MLRRSLVLTLILPSAAWAQASLRPDPTPRVPPQPGQGLPAEDVRFLRDAAALSGAQVEAASRAVPGQGGGEGRALATSIAERHRRIGQELAGLMRQHGVEQAPPSQAAAQAIRDLSGAGRTERDFLAAQLDLHALLIAIYQAEASQTTDRELGRFAITTMVGLQEDFSAAARLGAGLGLAVPDRLRNPPQYGPGAGPAR